MKRRTNNVRCLNPWKSQAQKVYSTNGVSATLSANGGGQGGKTGLYYIKGDDDLNYKIRKLTPRECERLQGFPDDYTKLGKDNEPISDTQRYKCLGNAVTTNVITYIFNNWDLNVE